MSNQNFYDSIVDFAGEKPLRMCAPGHKGKSMAMKEWDVLAPFDVPSVPATGDLYLGNDWIEEAERLWAWEWGMGAAMFCTEGSKQGLFTLLRQFTNAGDKVLVDRSSHQRVFHGLALFDLNPVILCRDWNDEHGLSMPITADQVEKKLAEDPEIKAMIVTSPTGFGVCSDLDAIAEVCHAHHVKLIADGIGGAHLPLVSMKEENCLIGYNPYRNCDGVVLGVDTVFPVPTQAVVIMANNVRLSDLRSSAEMTGTEAPNFPLMMSLDLLRGWMTENKGAYRKIAMNCSDLQKKFPALSIPEIDPCRLVLQVKDGYKLRDMLQAMNIYPQLADTHHVVCLLTGMDNDIDLLRLKRALGYIGLNKEAASAATILPPPKPEQVCTPHEAVFGKTTKMRLEQAEGKVAAQCINAAASGAPAVVPGERITKKILDYLADLCYDCTTTIMTIQD